jgi:hypothetical protein
LPTSERQAVSLEGGQNTYELSAAAAAAAAAAARRQF